MATSIRILHNYLTDASGVTLTGGTPTDATQYPVANVKDARVRKVTRIADETNAWLKFDFGSATQLTMWAFLNHNLTCGATVRLFGHTSDLGNAVASWVASATLVATFAHNSVASSASYITSGLITSGAAAGDLPPRYKNGIAYFNVTKRWWFFHIDDTGNADSYVELGRVVGGRYIEPTQNFAQPFNLGIDDESEELALEGVAQTVMRAKTPFHAGEFRHPVVGNTDLASLAEMYLDKGKKFEILFNPEPDTNINELYYAKLTSRMGMTKILGGSGALTTLDFGWKESA